MTRARIHKLLNAYIEAQIEWERANHIANFSDFSGASVLAVAEPRRKAEAARAAVYPAITAVTGAVQQLAIEKLRAWQKTWDGKAPATGATA